MSIRFQPKSFFLFSAKDRGEQSCRAVSDALRLFQRGLEESGVSIDIQCALPGEVKGLHFAYGFTDRSGESWDIPVCDGAVRQLIDLPEDTDEYHPVALRFTIERLNKTVGDTGSHYVRATDPETGMSCVADSGYWEKSANLARISLWARVTASDKVLIVTDKPRCHVHGEVPLGVGFGALGALDAAYSHSQDDILKLNAIRDIVKGWNNCPDDLKRALSAV